MKNNRIQFILLNAAVIMLAAIPAVASGESSFSLKRVSGIYRLQVKEVGMSILGEYTHFNSEQLTNETGMPELPVCRFIVYSKSPDIKIKIKSRENESKMLLERDAFPVQPPRSKQQDAFKFVKDDKFYLSSADYPAMDCRVIYAGKSGSVYLSIAEIYPFSYNPSRKELSVAGEIEFEIEGDILYSAPAWDEMPSKFLITTKNSLLASLSEFIEFKRMQGFTVEVLDIDTVGALNTEIKGAIQSIYDTSSVPLRYVLLAGDVDIIPNFTGTEMNKPPTDLYYSLLSGSDYMPDVFIGRFPSSDTTGLRIISEKTVMFEKAEWGTGDEWAGRAYLMASDDPTFHLVAESTQIYAASKLRLMGMTVDTMFDYYFSGTPVSVAFNGGRSVAVYSGHGSYTAWAGPSFTQTDIMSLTNGEMTPFVSSYACLTGNYALSYDCFGETWVKRSGGGAVSYMGSSVESYWDEDDYMERAFFNAMADSGSMFTGKLMNEAKLGVYTAYSGGGLSKRYYEMYNILGDPSLGLYAGVMDTLKISTMNPIPKASVTVDITVTGDDSSLPVANALVSILYNGDLYASEYTDSSGKVSFANPGFSGETLFVTASKPSYRYDNEAVLISSSSFYPYIEKMLFIDSIFSLNPTDSLFSPLDSGAFEVLVRNLGDNGVVSLQCSVFSTKGTIGFASPILSFPETLLTGDSSWPLSPLSASVAVGTKNNSRDTLNFLFKDLNDSTAFFRREVKIFAPFTRVLSADNCSGSGITGGDTVKMTLRVTNLSPVDDREAVIRLIPDDTTIMSFFEDSCGFSVIAANDTVFSDTISFAVSGAVDTFATASFKVFYVDVFGLSETFSFEFSVNRKDYAVIDVSDDKKSGYIIDSLLNDLGYRGDYLYYASGSELENYKHIFLSAGEYPNNGIISKSDLMPGCIDTLCRDGLANLYLEGGEVWFWDLYIGQGYDFSSLTKTDGMSDGDLLSSSFTISGCANSIAEGITVEYDGGISADFLDTLYGANPLFLRGDTMHAVSYAAPLYRTVGSSVCIGSLVDADSASSRREWVRRIMLFFEGTIGVNELNMKLPLPEFGFVSINSTLSSSRFRIFYNALKGERVTFRVFNSAGMEVMAEKTSAESNGLNSFVFNPSSKGLSSGVYFIRADNSKKSFTKKITVIK